MSLTLNNFAFFWRCLLAVLNTIQYFMNISSVAAESFRMDGRTDVVNIRVALRNY